jgi:hypothetical protein
MALTSSLWVGRMISGWVPLAFALSMLLGIVGTTVTGANSLFVWSGVVFGWRLRASAARSGRRRIPQRRITTILTK